MATEFDLAAAAGGFGKKKEYKENLNEVLICPDCRSNPPILSEEFASGDVVCGECGLVLGDRIIDTRSEWRTFANDDQGNDDPVSASFLPSPPLGRVTFATPNTY